MPRQAAADRMFAAADGKLSRNQAGHGPAAAAESRVISAQATGAGAGAAEPLHADAPQPAQSRAAAGETAAMRPAVQVLAAGQQGLAGASQAGASAQKAEAAAVMAAMDEEAAELDIAIQATKAAETNARANAARATPAALASQFSQASPALSQAMLAGGLMGGDAETGVTDTSLDLFNEMPGLSQMLTEAAIGTNASHRPETPRMIAAQIAEAFAAKGDQKVEISLNPQELGKVKMRVATSETGITMIIHTERPETGDLMRRHINELAEEFRRMGYEDISFEFSGGEAEGGQADDGPGHDAPGRQGAGDSLQGGSAETSAPITQNLQLGAAGLDMRV